MSEFLADHSNQSFGVSNTCVKSRVTTYSDVEVPPSQWPTD